MVRPPLFFSFLEFNADAKQNKKGLNNIIAAYPDKSAYALCTFSFSWGGDSQPIVFAGRTEVPLLQIALTNFFLTFYFFNFNRVALFLQEVPSILVTTMTKKENSMALSFLLVSHRMGPCVPTGRI
jgi:hypothetical protein